MARKKYQNVRESVTMDKELAKAYKLFENIPDHRASNVVHKLSDVFMSGLAMFSLKYASLLDFDQQPKLERENMKQVFGIKSICSDTNLRRILDKQSPEPIRQNFVDRFSDLQETGLLTEYQYKIGGTSFLIGSSDGVQHFSSKSINCPCCLEKKHRNGDVTYHHNMLCAALVHPEKREVFIMGSEPIIQQDGVKKNDCERNAAKRLFNQMSSDYKGFQSQYNFLIVEDALYANGPHLEQLQDAGFSYVINVKPKSHKTLFAQIEGKRKRNQTHIKIIREQGLTHRFEWANNVLLSNKSNLRVNVLHYQQTDKKGKKITFTWVTDIFLNKKRVWAVMKTGRSRWKIENETFNTLKNLGYNFEHNYGHGEDHLSTTLAYLMLLAFYIDQFVQACSIVFREIENKIRTKIRLWAMIKATFQTISCKSMEFIYRRIASLYEIKLE